MELEEKSQEEKTQGMEPNIIASQSNLSQDDSNPEQVNPEQVKGAITRDNLPDDVKNGLPEEAQGLFIAAYNGFLENSDDPEAATRVAWQTIEMNEHYAQGEDGKWYRLPDNSGQHSPISETAP
ncbi:MAG: hypothetical protein HC769_06010 [Cyanobacteria bacterium CRU_2_1]|nr:hypothetical protein [Cyanobacteria bacterium RU_5_0]NJR58443.1 hypothetical protein [Cyanobacteria bacterium CRU_2_1]